MENPGTIWGSFDRDFQEVSDNIRHHWDEIDIAANAANIQASDTARELEKTERQGASGGEYIRDTDKLIRPSAAT
jgi:hypothetical protein